MALPFQTSHKHGVNTYQALVSAEVFFRLQFSLPASFCLPSCAYNLLTRSVPQVVLKSDQVLPAFPGGFGHLNREDQTIANRP